MSLLSENVIPGEYGKVFGTNAKEEGELLKVQKAILTVAGVKDCILQTDVFPRELTVHTSDMVTVKAIEDAVISTGFHAIPKHLFPL